MRFHALDRKAKELNKEAEEIYKKAESTSQILNDEYLSRVAGANTDERSSSDSSSSRNPFSLDQADLDTMEYLRRRIRLLTEAYEKAENEANHYKARARKAELDLRAFSKDASLDEIDTCMWEISLGAEMRLFP